MDTVKCNHVSQAWYKHHKFPLLPLFEHKEVDQWNTSSFFFRWLFIKVWSRDAFDFEIAFGVGGHWGIGFTALIPYLRIVCCIPCPDSWATWMQNNLWRKP